MCDRVAGTCWPECSGSRDIALLDIGNGLAALVYGREKVHHVMADRGRDVLLEFRLGLVFRILLEFVLHIFMDRLAALSRGNKIIAHDTRLQRAFVTIEDRAQGYSGSGAVAPRAMLSIRF